MSDTPPSDGPETIPPSHAVGRVVSVRPEGDAASLVQILPPRDAPWRPGQVAILSTTDGPEGYFAIATAPHEGGPHTFLIKNDGGGAGRALIDAAPGATVRYQGPVGAGFALTGLDDADLLFISAGTGLAPLRSVIAELLAADPRCATRMTLVHGARRTGDVAFRTELSRWADQGVTLRVVLSREAGNAPSELAGYVQHHLIDLVTPRTVAFLAGMPAMIAETRALLERNGVAVENVRTNF